jgi:photosystem II stability/assembly factor-like uncharacterized protein
MRYRAGLVATVGALLTGAQASYKGIWEPVNYTEDVQLNGVYFVTVDEGWVTGGSGVGAGILLHTADGGDHWEVALGDPSGDQRPFYGLRFVDQTTGFVVQGTGVGDHALLRTTDGQNWKVVGTVPQHGPDYRFISGTTGVTSTRNEIDRTTDAGRTWKKVFDCGMKVEVEGLSRNVRCEVAAFAFPSQTVGYGIGHSSEAKGLFVFKTEDAGASWTGSLAVPGDDNGREGRLFFTTDRTGYICTSGGKLFGTDDGGQTWSGLPGAACTGKADFRFADPEVGWTFGADQLTWTIDGGRRWVSRRVVLPAWVQGFSLPRRDRAYAVGDHGMIYRYRVVPEQTVIAHAVAGPAMPGVPTVLASDVTQLEGQFTALGGFVQSVPDAAAAGAAPVGTSIGAGEFAQSPPSAFVAGCCGKKLGALELVLKAVGGIVPDFLSKYKNLNLLAQGLRTAAALPEMNDSLRAAFKSFRTASDRPTAMTALTGVKSILASLKAAVDTALQKRSSPSGVSQ